MSVGLASVVALVCAGVASVLLRGPRPHARLARAGVAGALLAPPARSAPGPVLSWSGVVVRRALARRAPPPSLRPFVEAWAAQLRAGAGVDAALAGALVDVPGARSSLSATAVAVALADDVGPALRADAARLGDGSAGRAMRAAAACWSVARTNGGRLAGALEQVAVGMRADEVHRAHVRAQLAAPRATARLLAALPLLAVLMSTGLGMSPVRVLVSGAAGRSVLAAGLLLDALGLWWMDRLAGRAERDG